MSYVISDFSGTCFFPDGRHWVNRIFTYDSVDVLDRKGYIEATRANTGIPHFSITLSGFDAYANHFIPEYQAIFQSVREKIVNDHITQNKLLSSAINQPIRIIDHILTMSH